MVDFGSARVRTIKELLERMFRPGDMTSRSSWSPPGAP